MKNLINLLSFTYNKDRITVILILVLGVLLALAIGAFAPLPARDAAPSGYPYDKSIYGFNLTSGFNAKRGNSQHLAWDIALPIGTPLKAMFDSVVNFYGDRAGGMYVSMVNGPYEVQYMHLSKGELRNLKDGRIEKGDVIAYSGASGTSCTGPHVHVIVRWHGKPVNPDPYFKELI